jgi:ATP-dependent Lon protease
VLDPKQNHAFVDRYLEIPYDLSHTLFIATANILDTIPGPLRDRMEVIRLSGYTETEKLNIAKKHLIPELLENHGLVADQVAVDDQAILGIIRDYTAEAGVRNLERKLATVMRKIARKVAGGDEAEMKYRVEMHDLEPYLGLPSYEHEFAERHPEIGVATGLAWTSFGGEIMFIEATRMPGTGRTTVTGQLGDVMRESVQAAYSYVRSKARERLQRIRRPYSFPGRGHSEGRALRGRGHRHLHRFGDGGAPGSPRRGHVRRDYSSR